MSFSSADIKPIHLLAREVEFLRFISLFSVEAICIQEAYLSFFLFFKVFTLSYLIALIHCLMCTHTLVVKSCFLVWSTSLYETQFRFAFERHIFTVLLRALDSTLFFPLFLCPKIFLFWRTLPATKLYEIISSDSRGDKNIFECYLSMTLSPILLYCFSGSRSLRGFFLLHSLFFSYSFRF